MIRFEPDAAQPIRNLFANLAGRVVTAQSQTFANNFSNRHPWIQAGIRILENHLDLMGITLEVRRLVAFRKLLAFENHFTRGFVMQAYQGFSECRFPRTALSDETDDLLRVHIQTDTVHGVYDPFR